MTAVDRRAGVDKVRLLAFEDPADHVLTDVDAYGKDDAGITQLFAKVGDATVYRLTPPVAPTAIATPGRAFGISFQVSTTNAAMVYYSVRIECELTLIDQAQGRVELLSDASNPPTTVRARVAGGATGTLPVGVNHQDVVEAPLTYIVPPGHFVLLQAVDEIGSPSYTITTQTEQTF